MANVYSNVASGVGQTTSAVASLDNTRRVFIFGDRVAELAPQQSRNAQQVPSPMGVMPAQAVQSNRSDSDTIMDDIITDYKGKNPWGN